jgi:hypothetical protein
METTRTQNDERTQMDLKPIVCKLSAQQRTQGSTTELPTPEETQIPTSTKVATPSIEKPESTQPRAPTDTYSEEETTVVVLTEAFEELASRVDRLQSSVQAQATLLDTIRDVVMILIGQNVMSDSC